MNTIAPGDFSHFHSIAISLQNRASLSKLDRFLNRISFHNNIPANRFFNFTEWAIGHYKFSGGNGLPFDDAKVVRHKNVVTNCPFGEIKETIGGDSFFQTELVE